MQYYSWASTRIVSRSQLDFLIKRNRIYSRKSSRTGYTGSLWRLFPFMPRSKHAIKQKKAKNIAQFVQKPRWDNYAVLIIQMAFFPPLSLRTTRQLPSSCSERSKWVLRSRTHTMRRRVHSVWSIDPRIDGSYVREKPYLQAPRHRRALTIRLAIINYVALKENELLWVAITMLNAAAQLSMMLQNKYYLSKRSFIGDW